MKKIICLMVFVSLVVATVIFRLNRFVSESSGYLFPTSSLDQKIPVIDKHLLFQLRIIDGNEWIYCYENPLELWKTSVYHQIDSLKPSEDFSISVMDSLPDVGMDTVARAEFYFSKGNINHVFFDKGEYAEHISYSYNEKGLVDSKQIEYEGFSFVEINGSVQERLFDKLVENRKDDGQRISFRQQYYEGSKLVWKVNKLFRKEKISEKELNLTEYYNDSLEKYWQYQYASDGSINKLIIKNADGLKMAVYEHDCAQNRCHERKEDGLYRYERHSEINQNHVTKENVNVNIKGRFLDNQEPERYSFLVEYKYLPNGKILEQSIKDLRTGTVYFCKYRYEDGYDLAYFVNSNNDTLGWTKIRMNVLEEFAYLNDEIVDYGMRKNFRIVRISNYYCPVKI